MVGQVLLFLLAFQQVVDVFLYLLLDELGGGVLARGLGWNAVLVVGLLEKGLVVLV